MNDFVEAIVADLRAFSATLLDPGLAPEVKARRGGSTPGSLAWILRDVDVLCRLVPRLLAQLQVLEFSFRTELVPRRMPRGARPSMHPADYDWYEEGGTRRLVPTQWFMAVPLLEVDSRPLAWLLHLLDCLTIRLEQTSQRIGKHLNDAINEREVSSYFARGEAEILRQTEREIVEADANLQRSRQLVLARANWRLVASPVRPSPYPLAPAWGSLRLLARTLEHPGDSLPDILKSLLAEPVHMADLPFLYQRWCGLKLIEALRAMGWRCKKDSLPVLFLGGELEFEKQGVLLSLWFEARIFSEIGHASGMVCAEKEASPDFLLLTPGRGGRDAFVLDATLSTSSEARSLKSKYLSTLRNAGMRTIAGVPTRHGPLASWAAAPIARSSCDLEGGSGRSGTVPMLPVNWSDAPLRAWLGDIEAHALAWGR